MSSLYSVLENPRLDPFFAGEAEFALDALEAAKESERGAFRRLIAFFSGYMFVASRDEALSTVPARFLREPLSADDAAAHTLAKKLFVEARDIPIGWRGLCAALEAERPAGVEAERPAGVEAVPASRKRSRDPLAKEKKLIAAWIEDRSRVGASDSQLSAATGIPRGTIPEVVARLLARQNESDPGRRIAEAHRDALREAADRRARLRAPIHEPLHARSRDGADLEDLGKFPRRR